MLLNERSKWVLHSISCVLILFTLNICKILCKCIKGISGRLFAETLTMSNSLLQSFR